jgi:hypothetical protein
MTRYWDELATEYRDLTAYAGRPISGEELHSLSEKVRALIGRAASNLPRDNSAALVWFISALQRAPEKWFVAKVMSVVTPVPSSLLEPMLLAALLEPDASACRVFVEPCLRTFGREAVVSRIESLAAYSGVAENDGVEKVGYWCGLTLRSSGPADAGRLTQTR